MKSSGVQLFYSMVIVALNLLIPGITIGETTGKITDESTKVIQKAERPGWLGVGLRNQESEPDQAANVTRPVVKNVFRNSPAERAGILAGDVILAIGDTDIIRGMQQMISIVQSQNEGTEVVVRVDRAGKNEVFRVVLATPPARGQLIKSEWIGRSLPELTLRDVQTDEAVSISSFLGQVVVIDFWATWCGPCKAAMPLIEELHERYKADGVVVIGVSDEERHVVEKFELNRPVEYIMAYDKENSLASNLFINSYPTFLVIDQKGNLTTVLQGLPGAQQLDNVVSQMLKQQTP